MTGLYIVMGVTAVVAVIVVLSFVGPEKAKSHFGLLCKKIRTILDRDSYWIICAIAVSCIAATLIYIGIRLFI